MLELLQKLFSTALEGAFIFGFFVLSLFGIPTENEKPSLRIPEIPLIVEERPASPLVIEKEIGTSTPLQKIETTTQKIAGALEETQKLLADAQKLLSLQSPAIDENTLNTNARNALVNIYCSSAGTVRPATGSGVLIDPRGIILTNAHVAQYFLLEDYPRKGSLDCIIRTGAPATPYYDAKLIYISPLWIKNNTSTLTEENPTGTGEDDFALLFITESKRVDTPLPETFPFLPLDISEKDTLPGTPIFLASYPAGFLGSISISKDLFPGTTITSIKERFTFQKNTIDVVELEGNLLAQKGSSGGAVILRNTGKILGIVSTSSEGKTTDERNLGAITLAHINRSIFLDLGINLLSFLERDPKKEAEKFSVSLFPTLRKTLVDAIEAN